MKTIHPSLTLAIHVPTCHIRRDTIVLTHEYSTGKKIEIRLKGEPSTEEIKSILLTKYALPFGSSFTFQDWRANPIAWNLADRRKYGYYLIELNKFVPFNFFLEEPILNFEKEHFKELYANFLPLEHSWWRSEYTKTHKALTPDTQW